MISKIAEAFRKHFQITEEDRKKLTPEQIERLEQLAREMMDDIEPTTEFNERKFDATDAVLANMERAKRSGRNPE